MSLLTQLYLAGLLTVSLPLVFHFLRRSPRGVLPFSSLMFLSPSPPRLTRRSRIDHWLLLLLRGLALVLLALAFCRPFFRADSQLARELAMGRRVAVLVDTSASMRRAGLWEQAEQALHETLESLRPSDSVALFSFDRRLRTVVDYAEDGRPASMQTQAVQAGFRSLTPSWSSTATGAALASLAERLESLEDRDGEERPLQIVLISDLQEGADLTALQAVSWPERVAVDVHAVSTNEPNGSVHVLERSLEETDPLAARVRVVSHAPTATSDSVKTFGPWQLSWRQRLGNATPESGADPRTEHDESLQLPPNGSHIMQLRRPDAQAGADQVVLTGDAHDFDNVCYVLPPAHRELRLFIWGDESPTDAEGLRLYLEQAARTAPHHELHVESSPLAQLPTLSQLTEADLVVIGEGGDQRHAALMRSAVEAGAKALLVMRDVSAAEMLRGLLPEGAACDVAEAGGDYALLTDIDFEHPWFAAMSGARFSDFTRIQFWRHRRVDWMAEPAGLRTVARFDDGDLAIGQWPLGQGRVTLLTSGWQPRDSRLALSSKFVPLVAGMLQGDDSGRAALQLVVDAPAPREILRDAPAGAAVMVHKPDGDQVPWSEGDFVATDIPGIYRLTWPGGEAAFAVNLALEESHTRPLEEATLAAQGVRLGQAVALGQEERLRQRRNAELEGRQKLWQWLLAGCLAVLIIETLLGAWFARASRESNTQMSGT
ncbi:MAG: BatA domain-containing protein [Planctomycetales bacterium]|nr:BatA domain-containing protein [Planctomycetales bacterium]